MYGSVIWGTATKTHIIKVQVLQNKVLRIICNAQWFIRNDQLHRELNITTVKEHIRNNSRTFYKNIASCEGALHYNLVAQPEHRRLKRSVPIDLIQSSDSDTISD